MFRRLGILLCLGAVVASGAASAGMSVDTTETPAALVATYDSLADTILGAKRAEWNLVHSILATTYAHAAATHEAAGAKMRGGEKARAEVEKLAKLVAQLGNEGDASVAAVRKRLLEGGHHHNAAGEKQGIYDEGFVVVTRAAKKSLLDAARAIGKLAGGSDARALDAEWSKVEATFEKLHEDVP